MKASKDKGRGKTQITELLTRGIEKIYPSPASFDQKLKTGRPLKIYYGIDPTGPALHLGHGSVLLKLKDFQNLGHQIIILVGDFTAMIGDPSGKLKSRAKLTPAEIKNNYRHYKKTIGRILDLKQTTFKFNSRWFNRMTFNEVVELASEFTVGQMIERDMFKERIKKSEPIYLHEFLYPLIQGYDSVALGIDAEIGASDQTFNMLAGRNLMKRRQKEKFVITTKLLVDEAGNKMGKTESNMVTLADNPENIYGKIMSWPDSLMPLAYEICTRRPEPESRRLLAADPKKAKMKLAREIIRLFISPPAAERAEADFIAKFQTKKMPAKLPILKIQAGDDLAEVLVKNKLVVSKSEFRRLLSAGGITLAGQKISDLKYVLNSGGLLKIGKKKFINLAISSRL